MTSLAPVRVIASPTLFAQHYRTVAAVILAIFLVPRHDAAAVLRLLRTLTCYYLMKLNIFRLYFSTTEPLKMLLNNNYYVASNNVVLRDVLTWTERNFIE